MLGEQKKLKARKMLENSDESPPSSARCVGRSFSDAIFLRLCFSPSNHSHQMEGSKLIWVEFFHNQRKFIKSFYGILGFIKEGIGKLSHMLCLAANIPIFVFLVEN